MFAERFGLNREDAEDVAIEILAKFWKSRAKLQEVRYLPAFLYRSMRNGCIDFLKKKPHLDLLEQQYGGEYTLVEEDDFLDREQIRAEVLRKIEEEIKDLPEKYRVVFELTYYEGLNTQQIAERLGISVTNVTSRRSRALKMLKTTLLQKDLHFLYLLLIYL